MGFFNDIRGMLKTECEGRYLENIVKFASEHDHQILIPLIGKKLANSAIRCDAEYEYKKGRRADLVIHGDDFTALVEIKAEDGKNKGNADQLKDYIEWVSEELDTKHERKLILLNKYPTTKEINSIIKELPKDRQKQKVKNITFTQYAEELKKFATEDLNKSNFKDLLIEYFTDEGLVMFEFNKEDSDAFTSFMVLNFLPGNAGHGRQAIQKKIARGPEIFTQLVQNWQLVSEQFARLYSLPRRPTVRYWSHQGYKNSFDPSIGDLVRHRREIRTNKNSGTWTIYSDSVIADSVYLEFGIEYAIETKKTEISEDESLDIPVKVNLYSAFRMNKKRLFVERKALNKGIRTECLKSSFDLVSEIAGITRSAIKHMTKQIDDPKLRDCISEFDEKLKS